MREGTGNPSYRLRPQASMGPLAHFGQSGWVGLAIGSSRHWACTSWPCPNTATGFWPGRSPTLPGGVVISIHSCEPTWLGDTSSRLWGPWTISLLLITLSKVIQVAHITRFHAHEACKALHVIVPGGQRSGVRARGQRSHTRTKKGSWALTWLGLPAAAPPRE